ncbi:MAG: hypothetical protein NTZ10_01040 [Candidatus Saganbacteria bacterium]|nr:hypothetical protein [Candidatus Saganbacteria bacterium]
MLSVSRYGYKSTLGKFMFGHGRFLGVHNPLSSNVRKAEDPFINNWTLRRLSMSDDQDVQNKVIKQLARRMESGTISVEKLMSIPKVLRNQALVYLNTIAEVYFAGGIIPEAFCIHMIRLPGIDLQSRVMAFNTVKASLSFGEIQAVVESLNDGDPMLALLSFADNADRKALMRIIEKSPEDHSNAFKRLSEGLSGADISQIYTTCKDKAVMGLIAAHPETPQTVLLDIALKLPRAKAPIEGVHRAQAILLFHHLEGDVIERLFNVADNIYILELIKSQPNASADLIARCNRKIAEKGK